MIISQPKRHHILFKLFQLLPKKYRQQLLQQQRLDRYLGQFVSWYKHLWQKLFGHVKMINLSSESSSISRLRLSWKQNSGRSMASLERSSYIKTTWTFSWSIYLALARWVRSPSSAFKLLKIWTCRNEIKNTWFYVRNSYCEVKIWSSSRWKQ